MRGAADKLKGKVVKLKGYIKAKIGDATDNSSLEAEGVKDQTNGETKQAIGRIKDALDERHDNA